MKFLSLAIIFVVSVLGSSPAVLAGGDWTLESHAIASGGSLDAQGGAWTLQGTIGQAEGTSAHALNAGDWRMTGGFWGFLAEIQDQLFRDRFQYQPLSTFKDCAVCPTMVMIPAGTFTQGSPDSEPESLDSERPQRTVNLPAFAIGQTEVTFAQWDACVADGSCTHVPDDNGWGRGDRPVIGVSWNDAQEYVAWLSNRTGQAYRLPSESEREYATRAGTAGRFNTGHCISSDQANFSGTNPAQGCPSGIFREQTMSVASFAPNAFGLYDTHGNVWEWVQDCWNENYVGAPTDGSAWLSGECSLAVARGGSWTNFGPRLRSARRVRDSRGLRSLIVGFRVARSVTL